MNGVKNSTKCLTLLSEILLAQDENAALSAPSLLEVGDSAEQMSRAAAGLSPEELAELDALATSHHVIMRAFPRLQQMMSLGGSPQGAEWAGKIVEKERLRIQNALSFLEPISGALEEAGKVVVIKSLDHWPDLGNDLDLFTNAEGHEVVSVMTKRFKARPDARS
jgi:hypothetical protein